MVNTQNVKHILNLVHAYSKQSHLSTKQAQSRDIGFFVLIFQFIFDESAVVPAKFCSRAYKLQVQIMLAMRQYKWLTAIEMINYIVLAGIMKI